MGMFDKAKNAAKATKLKADIALLDRKTTSEKQKFGVEVSDLLWDVEAKQSALGGRQSEFLKALHNEWGVAKEDLQKIRDQKEETNQKIEAAGQLKREQQEQQAEGSKAEGPSVMDKAKAAGTEGKRRARLQLLDRELKARKQKFGVEVYEQAVKIAAKQSGNGGKSTLTDSKNAGAQSAASAVDKTKMSFVEKQLAKAAISTVSSAMNKMTVSDQDVLACILKCQEAVEAIRLQKDSKKSQLEALGQPKPEPQPT